MNCSDRKIPEIKMVLKVFMKKLLEQSLRTVKDLFLYLLLEQIMNIKWVIQLSLSLGLNMNYSKANLAQIAHSTLFSLPPHPIEVQVRSLFECKFIIIYINLNTYVLCAEKHGLIEMGLLSTHNICQFKHVFQKFKRTASLIWFY